jgi:hypothetical protein
MLLSILRALLIIAVLVVSLGVALAIAMALADFGYLGSCQDGACELAAVFYVMPILGVALYFAALSTWSIVAVRKRRRSTARPIGEEPGGASRPSRDTV